METFPPRTAVDAKHHDHSTACTSAARPSSTMQGPISFSQSAAAKIRCLLAVLSALLSRQPELHTSQTGAGSTSVDEPYPRYFASNRRQYDMITTFFSAAIAPIPVLLKTLEQANCSPGSGTQCSYDPHLNTFPQTAGKAPQALWVVQRLAWLPWYLAVYYHLHGYAIFLICNWTVVISAWRQSRWFLNGGRSFLMAVIRPVASVDSAVRLAIGLMDHQLIPLSFAVVCHNGSLGTVRLLVWTTVMCQVPLRLQLKLIGGELFALFSLNLLLAKHHGKVFNRSYLSSSLLAHIVLGIVFPTALAVLNEHVILKSFLASRRRGAVVNKNAKPIVVTGTSTESNAASSIASSSGTGATAASGVPGLNFQGECKGIDEQTATAVHPRFLNSKDASSALNMDASMSHAVTTCSFELPSNLQLPVSLADLQDVAPIDRIKLIPYKSVTKRRVFSIKVNDHSAFSHRAEVKGAVEMCLKQQYLKQTCATPHIRTAVWQGCLQLMVIVSEDVSGSPMHASNVGIAELEELMKQLPGSVGSSSCLIHAPSDGLMLTSEDGTYETTQCRFGSALGLFDGMNPFCFTADAADSTTVELQLCGGQHIVGQGNPVDVVCCFQSGEELQVVKQSLEACSQSVSLELPPRISPGPVSIHAISAKEGEQGAILGYFTTMALPQAVAKELSTLFDSLTSYVKPPALLNSHSTDATLPAPLDSLASHAEVRSGLWDLLSDLAVVWGMFSTSTAGASAVAEAEAQAQAQAPIAAEDSGLGAVTEELCAYFQHQRMPHCLLFISQLVSANPPPGQTAASKLLAPNAPGGSAAAATHDGAGADFGGFASDPASASTSAATISPHMNTHGASLPCSSPPQASIQAVFNPAAKSPKPRCSMRDALWGFADREMEAQYAEYRGGVSTAMSDRARLAGYILDVALWSKVARLFVHGILWRILTNVACAGAFALMVSSVCPRFLKHHYWVLAASRALAALTMALAIYWGWAVYDRTLVTKVADAVFDCMHCYFFWNRFINEMQVSKWLLAGLVADVLFLGHAFATAVGPVAAAARVLIGFCVSLTIIFRMDILARQSFLKQLQIRQAGKMKAA